MRPALFAIAVFLGAGTGVEAQVRPTPAGGDPRIQVVNYIPDQVVEIEATPGYQVTVELAPDEHVQTIAVGDTSAWTVSANLEKNRLFLKPLAAADTNMTVFTNARRYAFDLKAAADGISPYDIRFRYPDEVTGEGHAAYPVGPMIGTYRRSGTRDLWPDEMSDDGRRTFIRFHPDTDLPAIFAIDDQGREVITNGYMRDGLYVLDEVRKELIFRIDHRRATMRRNAVGELRR